jgi:HAD superfamily hydrolase (TIGR01549 family)
MTQRTDRGSGIDTVVLDLDGTLVDSVYHHTVAWQLAFHEVGLDVAAARIHSAIGMGGDRLVAHLAGNAAENAVGDHVRALHDKHFLERANELRALDGASDLMRKLRAKDFRIVLASSGDADLTDRLLSLVDASGALHAIVSGSDAENSKPAPDLIDEAMNSVDADRAVVIGDAVWDAIAARERGLGCIGLLTGGVCESDLRAAGASWVFDSPRDLLDNLESSPLA